MCWKVSLKVSLILYNLLQTLDILSIDALFLFLSPKAFSIGVVEPVSFSTFWALIWPTCIN